MTPRQAALHYAASLLYQALAACHQEVVEDKYLPSRTVPDTFEKAPPNVAQALKKGLDEEAVAEEMAKLAEELRAARIREENCEQCDKYHRMKKCYEDGRNGLVTREHLIEHRKGCVGCLDCVWQAVGVSRREVVGECAKWMNEAKKGREALFRMEFARQFNFPNGKIIGHVSVLNDGQPEMIPGWYVFDNEGGALKVSGEWCPEFDDDWDARFRFATLSEAWEAYEDVYFSKAADEAVAMGGKSIPAEELRKVLEFDKKTRCVNCGCTDGMHYGWCRKNEE